jgi:hypothetical protein
MPATRRSAPPWSGGPGRPPTNRPMKNSHAAQKGPAAGRHPRAARKAYCTLRAEPEVRRAYPEIRRAQAGHVERAAEGPALP